MTRGAAAGPAGGRERSVVGRTSIMVIRCPSGPAASNRRAGVGSARAGAAAPRPARSPASQRVRVLMTTPGGAVGPVVADVIGMPALPDLQILPIPASGGESWGGGVTPRG